MKSELREWLEIDAEIKKIRNQLKPLEARKSELKEIFGEHLTEAKLNELIIDDHKIYWRKGQKIIDSVALIELIGEDAYTKLLRQVEYIAVGKLKKPKKSTRRV